MALADASHSARWFAIPPANIRAPDLGVRIYAHTRGLRHQWTGKCKWVGIGLLSRERCTTYSPPRRDTPVSDALSGARSHSAPAGGIARRDGHVDVRWPRALAYSG
jgi:hypothetical protein